MATISIPALQRQRRRHKTRRRLAHTPARRLLRSCRPLLSCSSSISAACSGRCGFRSRARRSCPSSTGSVSRNTAASSPMTALSLRPRTSLIFGVLFISGCLILGFLLAVFIDQNVRGGGSLPHGVSLPVRHVVRRHRRRLAMVPQPRPRPAEARARHGLSELHLRLARQPGHGDLHHRHRGPVAWLRPDHGDPARRAARRGRGSLEGRARSMAFRPGGFIPPSSCLCFGP